MTKHQMGETNSLVVPNYQIKNCKVNLVNREQPSLDKLKMYCIIIPTFKLHWMEYKMVGAKIRALREEHGMSLSQLAKAAGISQSAISQIELGTVDPSLRTLRAVAETLKIPIFTFFLDSPSKDIVVRKDRRRSFSPPGYKGRYELISPDSMGKVEMIYMSIEPGTSSSTKPLIHAGDECMVVLQGKAGIIAEDERFELEVGDSIYLHEGIPHQVVNVGDEELVCIVAISPPSF
jgi:transcriptional regulator with XRE-family HTH domain